MRSHAQYCVHFVLALCLPTASVVASSAVPGDMDGDLDVDLRDAIVFINSVSGPGQTSPPPGVDPIDFANADFDDDLDVDLADVAAFEAAFTGVAPHRLLIPSPGQSPGEKIGTVCESAHNIYLHSGEFTEQRTLLTLPQRAERRWDLIVTYRSGIVYDGPLGKGWDFNQNVWLEEVASDDDVFLYDGFGRQEVYEALGPGLGYASPAGSYDLLTKEPDGRFTLRDRHGTVRQFNEAGLLESSTHRTGNVTWYEYDPLDHRLVRVVDTIGREIQFYWDVPTRRLISVVDPEGRQVSFDYNVLGQLVTITLPPTPDHPAGTKTTFTYTTGYGDPTLDDNLLTIEDAKNQVYLENVYDPGLDRVGHQRFGPPSAITHLDYLPGMTTVTDHYGHVVDFEYDAKGLPCRTTIHTLGLRPTDPPTYVWQQQHNADAELTHLTMARGNSIEYVYDQSNPDPLQRGNLLEVRNVSHLPGEPTLTIGYTYEPLYNQAETITDARGQTTVNYFDYQEALLGDLNGDGLIDQAAGNIVMVAMPTATLGQPAPQPIVRTFWYDAMGNPIGGIEPDGQVIAYTYWVGGVGDGMLRSETRDDGGLSLTTMWGRNARGDVLWETDPGGNTTTYDINAQSQVMRKTGPAPFFYEREYHYDGNGNVISEAILNVDAAGTVDPNMPWITTTLDWDILDNLASMTQQVSPSRFVTTEFTHNESGLITLMREPEGNEQRWVYDGRNLLYQHIRGYGSVEPSATTYYFDGNRNLTRTESQEGAITTYTYDGLDRRIGYQDAAGNTVETEYEDLELITAITHRDVSASVLRQRTFAYDEPGRLYREDMLHEDSLGVAVGDGLGTTLWQRDPCNRAVVKTFDDGGQLLGYYDGVGRLEHTVRQLGDGHTDQVHYEWDALGNLLVETRALYNEATGGTDLVETSHVYDALGRCIRTQREPSGIEYDEFGYNSRSQRTVRRDALGTTIRHDFDGLGRELEQRCETPAAYTMHQTVWDDNSRVGQQVDANGNCTTYQYDPLNRLIELTYADSTQRNMVYDGDDRLIMRINPTGTVEEITPDHRGFPLVVDVTPGPGVIGPIRTTYQYDGLGRVIAGETWDTLGPITSNEWYFDTMSNLEREVQWSEGVPVPQEVLSQFDGLGNKKTLVYPSGMPINYTYDLGHRLDSIGLFPDLLAEFAHVGRRLASAQYGNGARTDVSYDTQLRPIAIEHTTLSGTFAFESAYDATGRRKYEQRLHDLKGDAYHYDEMGQLLGTKYGVPDLDPSRSYASYATYDRYAELTLDHQQNRLALDDNGAPISYTPDTMNRYTSIAGIPRGHDANGNLTSDGSRQFTYNSRNLLAEVQPSGPAYLYDCIGRRVREIDSGGNVQYLFYDREHCIERRDQVGAPVARYVWGNDLDDLVVMISGGQYHYCHDNALGSTCVVTDSSGTATEKIEYDTFGAPAFFTYTGGLWLPSPQSVTGLPYLFTGQLYDHNTGLYFYKTRSYDPTTGRYLQPDAEMGLWQQYENLYSYADNSNDPVNGTSPYGTGGGIPTQSWTSGDPTLGEPYYEHVNNLGRGGVIPEVTQNKITLHKNKKVGVERVKTGPYGSVELTGNTCNSTNGINVRVERNGDTVEIYVDFDFTIKINTSRVCKPYKERDPEIVKKRNDQGKPIEAHVTEDYIRGHEEVHVDQLMAAFNETIAEWSQKLDVKTEGFPEQLKEKLKKAYDTFNKSVHAGYPRSAPEREARQKAWEKWDRTRPKPKGQSDKSTATGRTSGS